VRSQVYHHSGVHVMPQSLQKLTAESYKFPVPPIIFSTLFVSISPTFRSRTLQARAKTSLSTSLTNRPGGAGSLSVAMPGPARILLMKTSPAQMYAFWWPGLDQAVRIAGMVPCADLLLTLPHKLRTKQKDLACADQISQLVFGHLSLVPVTSSSYWLFCVCAWIFCACIPDRRRLCGRWVRQLSTCNIAWALLSGNNCTEV